MAEQIRVVAAIISRGDELLVCQRPLHKRHGGLWEFPGGKCEPGESDTEAVRREILEELGVEATAVGRTEFEIADAGSPYLIVFIPAVISGDLRPTEHTAVTWATMAELSDLLLAPSDRRYVDFRSLNAVR